MLVEALVGLALVGVALLLTAFLLAHERSIVERAAAQRAALETAEAVLELVRAGQLPLADTHWGADEPPLGTGPSRWPADFWLAVEADEVPDLWRVEVTARYTAAHEVRQVSLGTRVWRPTGAS